MSFFVEHDLGFGICGFNRGGDFTLGSFARRLLESFGGNTLLKLAGFAGALRFVVFVGVEDQVQPGHHLLDGGERTGGAGLAAGALFAARTLRALLTTSTLLAARALFTTGTLRPGFALRADRTGLAIGTRLAGDAGFALRTSLALRTGFADRALLAAGPLGAGTARMSLWSRSARFTGTSARALRPRTSAAGGFSFSHATPPNDS